MSEKSMTAEETRPWPSPPIAWYGVAVLFLAYVFAFIDRQILSLMVEAIKADLELSDTQISVLHGLAFVVFYALVGIPIGRLVDRRRRTTIVGVGIAFWSFMTALCGLARGFGSLFAARVGVGIGEAALTPSAYSLIADYFAPEKRGRALAVYSVGITAGGGLALILGGKLFDYFDATGPLDMGLFGVLSAWQLTFIAVGLPGLLVAVLALTMREPARRGTLRDPSEPVMSLKQAITYVWDRKRAYLPLFVGLGLLSMVSYSFIWLPSFFIREFGWTPGQYGLWVGWIVIIFGSLGILAGGVASDKLTARGRMDAPLLVLIAFGAVSIVFAVATPLMPGPYLSLAAYAVATFFLMAPFGLAPTAIQILTPNELRGQVSALYLLVMNLLGLGLGPIVVAVLTDTVFRDETLLGLSIAVACAVLGPLSILTLLYTRKPFMDAIGRS
ncbi:MAG: MFS transporter [Pseudomonadota bacterium]